MAVADRYELRVEAPGLQQTVRNVRELENVVGRLRHLRIAENNNLNNLRRDITATRQEMERLEQVLEGGGGTDTQRARYEQLERELEDLRRQADASRDRIRQFSSSINESTLTLHEWEDEIEGAVSAFEHLARALQMAGKASEWTKSFADDIGQAFTSMSKLFDFDAFNSVE